MIRLPQGQQQGTQNSPALAEQTIAVMIRRTFVVTRIPWPPPAGTPLCRRRLDDGGRPLLCRRPGSLGQYVSFQLGLPSTQVAFHQYLVALICLLPWLIPSRPASVPDDQPAALHLLRVALAVIGIQFWLWALAVPVPIWQGSRCLMTSPCFTPLGSALLLKEQVSRPGSWRPWRALPAPC